MTRRIRDKCNFKTAINNEESRGICNRDNNIVLVNHDKCRTEENTGVMLIIVFQTLLRRFFDVLPHYVKNITRVFASSCFFTLVKNVTSTNVWNSAVSYSSNIVYASCLYVLKRKQIFLFCHKNIFKDVYIILAFKYSISLKNILHNYKF